MGLINFYRHLDSEQRTEKANGVLSALYPEVNWKYCIIICNDHRVNSDYEVKENDVVFVRECPSAMSTLIIGVIASVLIVGGVVGGILLHQNKKQQMEMEKAQKMSKDLADKVEALPFCKGASNVPATGRTFPYILGRTYFAPYRMAPKFYEVGGEKGSEEYVNIILETGFNPLVIDEINLGSVNVFKGTSFNPQNGIYHFKDGTVYSNPNNIIEIRQSEEFETEQFKKKIVSDFVNKEVKHDWGTPTEEIETVVQSAQPHAKAIDVCILFDGLRKYDSNGAKWGKQKAIINAYWTNEEDADPKDLDKWHLMEFDNEGTLTNEFEYNSNKQMRFIAHKEFTPEEALNKNITVMLRRATPKSESNSQESCYFYFLNTEVYDPLKSSDTELVACVPLEENLRSKCTRIAIRMKADEKTTDFSDNVNVIAMGCARVWDKTTRRWSLEKVPTSNPAAWFLEVLTSDVHPHSKYLDREIDLLSIGALYEYCERKNFFIDGAITQDVTKKSVIDTILSTCNATLVYDYSNGLLTAYYDDEEFNAVALLNSQTVKDISITKTFKRKTDCRKITFINNESWETESFYYNRDGTANHGIEDVVSELSLPFVTHYAHAVSIARRQMAQEILQPREISLSVGREGAYYPLYSCVDVQLPHLNDGKSNAIITRVSVVDDVLAEIELDEEVEFISGKLHGIIVQIVTENTNQIFTATVTGTGKTKVLEVVEYHGDIFPVVGNALSFGLISDEGNFDTVVSRMKIYNISVEGQNSYKLTLKDYNPAIYDDSGSIPPYVSNATTANSSNSGIGYTNDEIREQIDNSFENYYSGIADDSNISPEEKKVLYKEWKQIQNEYINLLEEAKEAEGQPQYTDYVNRYNELYTLLIIGLKVFKDMASFTEIEDRDAFISTYDRYYEARDTLRSSLYNSLTSYNLDLSPEYQAFPVDSSGNWLNDSLVLNVSAMLLKGIDGVNYAASYKALYNGLEIGTWEGNKFSVALSELKNEINYIQIVVTDSDDITIAKTFTVGKIVASEFKYYHMQLSDNAINVRDGIANPESITATKLLTISDYTIETDDGIIKVKIDDGEEQEYSKFKKVTTEEYSEEKNYFTKAKPFMIAVDGEAIAESRGAALVFFV